MVDVDTNVSFIKSIKPGASMQLAKIFSEKFATDLQSIHPWPDMRFLM